MFPKRAQKNRLISKLCAEFPTDLRQRPLIPINFYPYRPKSVRFQQLGHFIYIRQFLPAVSHFSTIVWPQEITFSHLESFWNNHIFSTCFCDLLALHSFRMRPHGRHCRSTSGGQGSPPCKRRLILTPFSCLYVIV